MDLDSSRSRAPLATACVPPLGMDRRLAPLLQVAPFLKLYTIYVRNYESALATLARCTATSPALADFLREQAALPRCDGLPLAAYLIKPVQRLTKYPLFWRQLLKHTPRDHPERATLLRAEELVTAASASVNQHLSEDAARTRLLAVLRDLGPEWLWLLAPHRKLICEFAATAHVGRDCWPARGYVLTDLLLICRHETRSRRFSWSVLRASCAGTPAAACARATVVWGTKATSCCASCCA